MKCECPVPQYCKRHGVQKTEHWHNLCQTREDYRKLWDSGKGPGQNKDISLNQIDCVFLKENVCQLISELTGEQCGTTPAVCNSCIRLGKAELNKANISLVPESTNPERKQAIADALLSGVTGRGIGTDLKNLFSRLGIVATGGCGCKGKEQILNISTVEEVEKNLDKHISFITNNARKRGFPVPKSLVRIILKGIISKYK